MRAGYFEHEPLLSTNLRYFEHLVDLLSFNCVKASKKLNIESLKVNVQIMRR